MCLDNIFYNPFSQKLRNCWKTTFSDTFVNGYGVMTINNTDIEIDCVHICLLPTTLIILHRNSSKWITRVTKMLSSVSAYTLFIKLSTFYRKWYFVLPQASNRHHDAQYHSVQQIEHHNINKYTLLELRKLALNKIILPVKKSSSCSERIGLIEESKGVKLLT